VTDRDAHKPFVSLNDLTVFVAILGLVVYGFPIALEIVGGNLLAAEGGPRLLLVMLAMFIPGAVGIWAAWRRHTLVLWAVAALVIGAWLIWWREFVLVAPVPVLYALASFLAWIDRRRRLRDSSG